MPDRVDAGLHDDGVWPLVVGSALLCSAASLPPSCVVTQRILDILDTRHVDIDAVNAQAFDTISRSECR